MTNNFNKRKVVKMLKSTMRKLLMLSMISFCYQTVAQGCTDGAWYCELYKIHCGSDFMTSCRKTCNACGGSGQSGCPSTQDAFGNLVAREKRYEQQHLCCNVDNSKTCGKSFITSQKVTGGENAVRKQWSWVVSIFNQKYTLLSGGSILNNRFVLTATHNFFDGNMRPYNKDDYKVYFGMLTLGDTQNYLTISELHHYSGLNFRFPYHDISIIKLSRAIRFSSLIQPICLPGGQRVQNDETCFIAGWGSTGTSRSASWNLQQAGIKIFDPSICKTKYRLYREMQPYMGYINGGQNYICAGSLQEPIGSCIGDSGGPLMCQSSSSCRWHVAGIVSFGLTDCTTPGVPSFYTKVSDYEWWINRIIS